MKKIVIWCRVFTISFFHQKFCLNQCKLLQNNTNALLHILQIYYGEFDGEKRLVKNLIRMDEPCVSLKYLS